MVEKLAIKYTILKWSRFLLFIRIIDGRLIPLYFRPIQRGEDYFVLKINYVFTILTATDHEGKFLYVHVGYGYPDSICDIWVSSNTNYGSIQRIFSIKKNIFL
jgi:hypothetical protein